MFSFFKSRPKAASSRPPLQPNHNDDDVWNVSGGPGGAAAANGGYDDVAFGDNSSSADLTNRAGAGGAQASASRTSFSAPRATAGSFVGVTTVDRSTYDSATSTSNLAGGATIVNMTSSSTGDARGGATTTAYPPQPSSSTHRIASTNGYPSLRSTFNRLEAFLSESCPTLSDSLSPPLSSNSPSLISLLHAISPYYLPTAVIESYTLHDGQDPFASCQEGLVFGLRWLPIDEVEQEWNFWRAFEQAGGSAGLYDAFSARTVEARREGTGGGRYHAFVSEGDEHGVRLGEGEGEGRGGRGAGDEFASGMSSFPPGWVRSRYSHPGWLPLLTDRAGNYIGVDLDPPPPPPASVLASSSASSKGPAGTTFGQPGQVIAFGREIDEKVVLFPGDSSGGWGRFLAAFVDDLSRGEFARLRDAADDNELSGSSSRRGGSSWGDVESGANESSGEDDQWENGDGLGELSYFDGDRYGDDGERGVQLWALRSEYRKWISSGAEGGVIAALAERSRRQWKNVGVGLDPVEPPKERQALSIVVPEREGAEPGPESSHTERPGSPSLMAAESARQSLENGTTLAKSTTTSTLANGDDSFTSDHPLNSSNNNDEATVEVTLSPPSPKAARFQGLQEAAEIHPPRSPDHLDDGRPGSKQFQERRAAKRRRPPPPAPMPFDLPTMDDLDFAPRNDGGGPLAGVVSGGGLGGGGSHHHQMATYSTYSPSGGGGDGALGSGGGPDSPFVGGGPLGTPTRETLLPSSTHSASSAALVQGEDDDAGLGLEGLSMRDGSMEIVVDPNTNGRVKNGRSSQSPPPSDQPYVNIGLKSLSPRNSEDTRTSSSSSGSGELVERVI